MKIAVTILQLLSALVLILIVLFQSGKSQGLSGAIGGIADSYMSRSKARSVDAKLAKATKWVGAIFVILTLVLNCMVAAGLLDLLVERRSPKHCFGDLLLPIFLTRVVGTDARPRQSAPGEQTAPPR